MVEQSEGIGVALRRRGVAASTLREALGDYVLGEPEKIVRKLAAAPSTLEGLIAVQADAKAFTALKRELDFAMQQGNIDSE